MSQKHKYKFYATLLNAFQNYLNTEANYEQWGCYQGLTLEEFSDKQERELIDKINRGPFSSPYADDGIKCEELVVKVAKGELILPQATLFPYEGFSYNIDAITEIAEVFKGGVFQHFTKGTIGTRFGDVQLYGYIDNLRWDTAYDLKKTKNYDFGKFLNEWQYRVYLITLNQEGVMINNFEYIILHADKNVYREAYTNTGHYERDVQGVCEHFIQFLELNKARITDKKVFGLD